MLNGTLTKRWVWDGTQIAEQRDATGSTVQRQYYSQGEKRSGGSDAGNYYYTRDHLGSIREMTDTTATVRARYDYDPYGSRSKLTGDLDCDFGFTGHYYHAGSNLHLTLYRTYDQELGRWLSADPIGEEGGMNLYSYVADDPVNGIDLLGLKTLILVHRKPPCNGQQARDAEGVMSVFHDGEFQFSTPVNRYGYQTGSHGIYPGTYRVLPRTDADPTSHFPNGQPSVTAEGCSNPGDAGHGYHNVYIHPEKNMAGGDSRGCQTIAPEAVNRIKNFMDSDVAKGEKTTLKIYNYRKVLIAIPVK